MPDASKKVLVLGGGKEQLPMIARCKTRGYHTLLADGNPESPGRALADGFLLASTRDHEKIAAYAHREGIDAITSMITESGLYSMYYTASRMGLPTFNLNSVQASLSKIEMRRIFTETGINDLPYAHPTSLAEARAFARQTGFPLVIKSSDTGGQTGLFKIRNMDELEDRFQQSVGQAYQGRVILERFAEGPEINAVFTVYDGQIRDLIISDRMKDRESFGLVKRHLYPSRYEDRIERAVREKCRQLVSALELEHAIVFPQFIMEGDQQLVFLEIGVRIPGGVMNRLMEHASGIDITAFYLDICLGEVKAYESYRTLPSYPAGIISFLNAYPGPLKEGHVAQLKGKDQALAIEGVLEADYFQHHSGLPHITPLRHGGDRFFYIVTAGDTPAKCHQAFRAAMKAIDFLDESGQSLKREGFDLDSYLLDTSVDG
jgi:biotin carboxylase